MAEIQAEGAVAALGAAVVPPEVSFGGKQWRIGHPTQEAKAELEKLVVAVSEQTLEDLRGTLRPAKIKAMEDRLDGLILARQWQTWGTLWSEVVNGPLGFPLFLLSLMKPYHPTATVKDAEGLWLGANRPCRNALVMVLPGFFALLTATLPGEAEDRVAAAATMSVEILAALERATLTASLPTTPSP